MNRAWWGISLVLIFLVSLSLFLVFGQQVVLRIVEAVQYLAWLGMSTLRSIHQLDYWVVIVTAGSLFLLFQTLRWFLRTHPLPETGWIEPTKNPGRLKFWLKQTRMLSGHFIQESYALAELRRLVLAVLAYRSHVSELEVEEMLRAGELSVPAEVSDLFDRRRRARNSVGTAGVLGRLKAVFEKRPGRKPELRHSSIDPRLEEVVRFIERELEISYER